MKKSIFLLIATLTVLCLAATFVACNNDDTSGPPIPVKDTIVYKSIELTEDMTAEEIEDTLSNARTFSCDIELGSSTITYHICQNGFTRVYYGKTKTLFINWDKFYRFETDSNNPANNSYMVIDYSDTNDYKYFPYFDMIDLSYSPITLKSYFIDLFERERYTIQDGAIVFEISKNETYKLHNFNNAKLTIPEEYIDYEKLDTSSPFTVETNEDGSCTLTAIDGSYDNTLDVKIGETTVTVLSIPTKIDGKIVSTVKTGAICTSIGFDEPGYDFFRHYTFDYQGVKLPRGITDVSNRVFIRSIGLYDTYSYDTLYVVLSGSVKHVGAGVFYCKDHDVEIKYYGTKKEWDENVVKDELWDAGVTAVHCNDGTIIIPKEEV